MESAACVENIEAVGLVFSSVYQSINSHAIGDSIRLVPSVVKEQKAGSGGWAVASFDSSSMRSAKSEVKGKVTVTLRWCFPKWEA